MEVLEDDKIVSFANILMPFNVNNGDRFSLCFEILSKLYFPTIEFLGSI